MRVNEMTRVEEIGKDGIIRVNGRGLKHLTDQLRGEMEKELASKKDLGLKILDHGLAEHSPGWVEWWVVAKDERPIINPVIPADDKAEKPKPPAYGVSKS